jgi:hypothetical protein
VGWRMLEFPGHVEACVCHGADEFGAVLTARDLAAETIQPTEVKDRLL